MRNVHEIENFSDWFETSQDKNTRYLLKGGWKCNNEKSLLIVTQELMIP